MSPTCLAHCHNTISPPRSDSDQLMHNFSRAIKSASSYFCGWYFYSDNKNYPLTL